MQNNDGIGLMNDTKWDELRIAMYEYPQTLMWRTKDIENGYISEWDAEWYYHFRPSLNSYKTIEWVEILIDDEQTKQEIIKILKKIHVPGEVEETIIRVYGYAKDKYVDYI
nr:putative integron gene cassette protein [uncultured bacterium]